MYSSSTNTQASFDQTTYTSNYIIQGSETKRFNKEGKLESILNAKTLEHYEGLYITLFEQPHITFYPDQDDSGWVLHAQEGLLNHDNNMILLDQQVVLESSRAEDPIQSLKTSVLDLNYDTMMAHSSERVDLMGRHMKLSGKGLLANLKTEYIYLQQEIKGIYENK